MPIQTRTKDGKKQFRWGNKGSWFPTETQAHNQGMKLDQEERNRQYVKSGKVGSKAVAARLKRKRQLRQAGNWTEIQVK